MYARATNSNLPLPCVMSLIAGCVKQDNGFTCSISCDYELKGNNCALDFERNNRNIKFLGTVNLKMFASEYYETETI